MNDTRMKDGEEREFSNILEKKNSLSTAIAKESLEGKRSHVDSSNCPKDSIFARDGQDGGIPNVRAVARDPQKKSHKKKQNVS